MPDKPSVGPMSVDHVAKAIKRREEFDAKEKKDLEERIRSVVRTELERYFGPLATFKLDRQDLIDLIRSKRRG